MVRQWVTCTGSCLIVLVAASAAAHHSIAGNFDASRRIEVAGTVKEYKLQSPHSLVLLEVKGTDGSVVEWEIEAGAAPTLRRAGWNEATLKPGDSIKVAGAMANRNPESRLVFALQFTKGDGTPIGTRMALPEAEASSSLVGARRVAGRWYRMPVQTQNIVQSGRPLLPLNAAALAVWATYDPRLSPATICLPNNVPSLYYVPYLNEIRIDDREVVFHHELYDVVRRVPFGSEPKQVDEAGLFGLATARIEGEEIVIESKGYAASKWGLAISGLDGGSGDVASSDQKTLVERYSVSEDGKRLRLRYTLTDPVFLTAPVTAEVELGRVADDSPIYQYQCEVESASRYDQGDAPPPIEPAANRAAPPPPAR